MYYKIITKPEANITERRSEISRGSNIRIKADVYEDGDIHEVSAVAVTEKFNRAKHSLHNLNVWRPATNRPINKLDHQVYRESNLFGNNNHDEIDVDAEQVIIF